MKYVVKNLQLREISSVDRPAQPGAVSVLIKAGSESDVEIRKNARDVAGGEKPSYDVTTFEDAMFRRADELAGAGSITPEQALAKGLSTDKTIMDLAHAAEVARAASYGEQVRKRHVA
jgi:hypothetical protein